MSTTRRLIRGTLAGTVLLVLWGMLFWGFLAGPVGVFHALPDPAQVTQALVASGTTTGTYFMPWPRNTPETQAEFERQHREGPFYRLSYVSQGVNPARPSKLILGVLQYALVALFAGLIAVLARPSSRQRTFLLVFAAGSMGTLFHTLGDPTWFDLPWDHALGLVVYEAVAWILVACSTAWVLPSTGPAHKTA